MKVPEKLMVTQVVKQFPAFYWTWRWIQSTPSHPIPQRSIV